MRIAIVLLFAAAVASFAPSASARVWILYPDGSGDIMTIQAGIDSCAAGDTVVVMPGVFSGEGNWDIDFKGKAIAVLAAKVFDPTITETTYIDYNDSEEYHRAFYFRSSEDSTSVLSGFVIRNLFYMGYDGTITCDHASPTISNNRIEIGQGDGISLNNSSARIIGNTIANYGGYGIPLSFQGGSPYIAQNDVGGGWVGFDEELSTICSGCTQLRMEGNMFRAGIWVSDCSGVIDDNRIGGYGWVLEILGSTLEITNNDITALRSISINCLQSAVTITGNRISGSGRYAKGIRMSESLPSIISGNDIGPIDNDSNDAAGIEYAGDSTSVIENNVIHDVTDGWGIKCHSSARIAGNLIYSSRGFSDWWGGGGIWCEASPVIEGNTIVENHGDGIYCSRSSSAIIRNNIIADNTQYSSYPGNGGINTESSAIVVSCCNVFNNEGANYVGIPDQTGINGNISIDPIFCDAAQRDYSLHELSPCAPDNHPYGAGCGLIGARGVGCDYIETLVRSYRVNAEPSGIVLTWELSAEAPDFRFIVLRCALPAEEYREISQVDVVRMGGSYSFRDMSCEPGASYRYRVDGVDAEGRRMLFETDAVSAPARALTLYQNYPNPFNPSTHIGYYVPSACRVTIEVYDPSGRRLACILDKVQERGSHVATWDGRDGNGVPMSSGVYFCRLVAGKESITKKMVMLR